MNRLLGFAVLITVMLTVVACGKTTPDPSAAAPSQPSAIPPATQPGWPQLYTCPKHPQLLLDQDGKCPICETPLTLVPPDKVRAWFERAMGQPSTPAPAMQARWPQLYICGMHPYLLQDHDGNCPACGMPLEHMPPDRVRAIYERAGMPLAAAPQPIQFYICTRHPQMHVQAHDGNCDICGMPVTPMPPDKARATPSPGEK